MARAPIASPDDAATAVSWSLGLLVAALTVLRCRSTPFHGEPLMTTTLADSTQPLRPDADRRPLGREPIEPVRAPFSIRRTAATIARVPFCTAEEVDRAVRGGRLGLAGLGRDAGRRTGARDVPVSRKAGRSRRRAGAAWSRASTARPWPSRGRRSTAASRSSSSPAACPA